VGRPDEPHRQVGAPVVGPAAGWSALVTSDVAAVGEALAGYENLLLIARLLDLSRIGPAAGGFIATVYWVVALLGCCRGT
jgi:hypothetical protein